MTQSMWIYVADNSAGIAVSCASDSVNIFYRFGTPCSWATEQLHSSDALVDRTPLGINGTPRQSHGTHCRQPCPFNHPRMPSDAHTHMQTPSHQFVCACQITIIKHYWSKIQLTSLTRLALVIGEGWKKGREGGRWGRRLEDLIRWRMVRDTCNQANTQIVGRAFSLGLSFKDNVALRETHPPCAGRSVNRWADMPACHD